MVTFQKIDNWPSEAGVSEWTLEGAGGLRVSILNYGATVTELHVPRSGKESLDVVLGFKDKARYAGDHPCFGVMVGEWQGELRTGD